MVDLDYVSGVGVAVGSNVSGDPTPWTGPLVMQLSGTTWEKAQVPGSTGCGRYSGADISLSRSWSGWMSQWIGCPNYDYWVPGTYTQGRLYEFSGTVWLEPVLLPNGVMVGALSMISPQEGWAGYYSTDPQQSWAMKYDGTAWSKSQYLGEGQTSVLQKISFARDIPGDGWALDSNSNLWRYSSGTWSFFDENRWNLLGIWVNSPGDAWAASPYSGIFHWDGASWTLSVNPPTGGVRDVSFLDANHGVAVGAYTDSNSQNVPLIMTYTDGVWSQVPASLPPGYIELQLTRVRMVSPVEAWAIGYGWDFSGGGQMNQPLLMHLKLPGTQAVAPFSASPAAKVIAPMSAAEPLTGTEIGVTNIRIRKADDSPLATNILFDVSGQCSAKVMIYDQMMIKIASFTMTASGLENAGYWSGKDSSGKWASSGWHLAVVEATNGGPVSHRILWFLPGTGSFRRSVVSVPKGAVVENEAEVVSPHLLNSKAEYAIVANSFHDMAVRTSRISRVQASPGIDPTPYGLRERAQTKNATPSNPAAASGGHVMDLDTRNSVILTGEQIASPNAGVYSGPRAREPSGYRKKR